ncbi:hypothetical protein [Williamsia sp.]|uniref:hypothetical protein n=1 Tax=Williamsia sp. TaxID=1872085 RepID=UPI001A2EFD54|nr:hypothetical protein [Williamsia sp.]MBJ7289174.1 hypothetical protein [Williamsia sp.]
MTISARADREQSLYERAIADADQLRLTLSERLGNLTKNRSRGDEPKRRRLESDLADAEKHCADLRTNLANFLAAKDRLVEWGPTRYWVVAGSIVTLEFPGRETTLRSFVRTDQPEDPDFEAVATNSPRGIALRNKRIGDRVQWGPAANQSALVVDVRPGFDDPLGRTQLPSTRYAVPALSRALRDDTLRRIRFEGVHDPHVRSINELARSIGDREKCAGQVPLVDPTFGGCEAKIIFLLKSPQADASIDRGENRLLSLDNDDNGAELMFNAVQSTGLRRADCVAWNLCPFPTVRYNPNDADISRGLGHLNALLGEIRNPRVIITFGGVPKTGVAGADSGCVRSGVKILNAPSPFARTDPSRAIRDAMLNAKQFIQP